jgi:hypothetical protein
MAQMRTFLRSAATLVLVATPPSFAAAADAGKLVDSIAPEVSEVASGGQWPADGKGGFYRALVVMAVDKAASESKAPTKGEAPGVED